MSAIIVKKQSRSRLLLAHHCTFQKDKGVLYIFKTTISKSTKKRYTTYGNLHISESGSGNATWVV